MKVKFLVRDSRVGKDGTSPIELSIIINNERKVITLDRRCNPSKWDSRTQQVKGSKDLNDYINLVHSPCKPCNLSNLHPKHRGGTEIAEPLRNEIRHRFLGVYFCKY